MKKYRVYWRDHRGKRQEPVVVEGATVGEAQAAFFRLAFVLPGSYFEKMEDVPEKG